jgi:uncharacterized protein (DUF1501 family)
MLSNQILQYTVLILDKAFALHPLTTNLTKAQKAVLIKIFNNLPLSIKQLSHDPNKFKLALKNFF